jgi:hypothetical protein
MNTPEQDAIRRENANLSQKAAEKEDREAGQ